MTTSSSYVQESYERDTDYVGDRITRHGGQPGGGPVEHQGRLHWPVERGRYRLVVARACPWANRALIVRRLLSLEDAISLAIAGPVHDADSWTFDLDPGEVDPVLGIPRLEDAYLARFPDYAKGITVPALVDVPAGQVVTNDYAVMTLDLSTEWTDHHRDGAPDLFPEEWREEILEVADRVYEDLNDGVYKAGFAGSQSAYETAFVAVFDRLEALSRRLERQRYLVTDSITEADVRLWTTLVRFDAVYHGHFKCNRLKLTEMPVLWAYARDLFQTPGFGDTQDFLQIKQHYYGTHTDINPTGVVPLGPDVTAWALPHHREQLGGSPFGDGTPPGPVPAAERVPAGHNPALPLLGLSHA